MPARVRPTAIEQTPLLEPGVSRVWTLLPLSVELDIARADRLCARPAGAVPALA